MPVRLDKWLHVARAFKTRSRATRACSLGRVRVNGVVAKAHRPVAVGDEIRIAVGDWTRILEVRTVLGKPVRKSQAPDLYLDLSPPRPTLDPTGDPLEHPVRREPGSGRPSKRERRALDRLRRR